MIESLDIRRAPHTRGRLPLHMAEATRFGDGPIEGWVGERGWLSRRQKQAKPALRWRLLVITFALPLIAVAGLILAYRILRWGLL